LSKRKRGDEMKFIWRINPSHKKLQSRLNVMQNFRRQHEQLRTVIARVLRPVSNTPEIMQNNNEETNNQIIENQLDVADANAIEEVNLAYEKVKEIDALDISDEGQEVWDGALRRYDERIERVEARMTARLRDQLGTAKNANEMFRIFSRFNALFVRPHIRGAIREYQTQLIQRVKDDIEALQEKFKAQYIQSKCFRMSKIRDIPQVAGSIIWAKQIERQLNMYMGRVEAVLGKGWETHVDGQKLKIDGDNFRAKLNTQDIFDDWSRKVAQKNLQNGGKIFSVDTVRASKGNTYSLKVNFSPEIITLTKEARNMKWLMSRIPLNIVNKAHTARQMYPYAISLIENVNTYRRICDRVNEKRTCQFLVAGMKKEIQSLIMDMSILVWDSFKLESSVQKFSEAIYNFREKIDELVTVETSIETQLKELDTCPYDAKRFQEILKEIQDSIDNLNLKGFSNLPQWVAKLDEEIERKFAQRLTLAIKIWVDVLLDKKSSADNDNNFVISKRRNNANQQQQNQNDFSKYLLNLDDNLSDLTPHFDALTLNHQHHHHQQSIESGEVVSSSGQPSIKPIVLEILIINQLLYVSPSIEDAREHLITQLEEFSSVVTTQKRIQHSKFQISMEAESEYKITYKNLLNKFQKGISLLEYAFTAIDCVLQQAQDYIKIWLHFQSLWDLQPDTLYAKLGSNLNAWICCLNEMKESRKSFDTQETQRCFGPIRIDYNKVQSKVNVKYDAWHKEVLSKFGQLLSNELQDFHLSVSKSRTDLESQSVEAASTSEAVGVITYVQSLKRRLKDWDRKVELYTSAQKILERQRYQFPHNWLHTEYIQGEWSAFNEILKRKDSAIQNQVASLQTKVLSEEKIVETKTIELIHEWEQEKPISGNLKPEVSLKTLQLFESKFNRTKEERDNMMKAKDALELKDNLANPNDIRITVSIEEMQDLKGVWTELSKVWSQIDEQKEKQWLTVQPRKLRATLDTLLNQLKEMPSRLRNYDSYNNVKKTLQDYIKSNLLITELKSEALKERHWKQLMKRMNVIWNLNDLTLGQIWGINLLSYEPVIREILLVAQGEKALEEFLKQVSELWKNYTLELIPYQNKCQIIRGWDDLFNKLKEHINSVSAMKLSPYYKEFEEEALSWEDKLNRINAVFDIWIDVQRRWVYLDGIFGGSADIKHLLPNETQKFQNVSSEFLTLMRKVSKSPLVLDILNIQGIQKTLERLADLLAKIQKALGEYLERERSSFPRFYFVGDEDLLEIIGNAKNIPRLQKHFKKMFAGVHSIILNEENTQVLGVASKEGEEVLFKNVVSIEANPKINDWLTLVEKEIRNTLAYLLNQSVQESMKFRSSNTSIDRAQYLEWAERYQAQLVVLSAQISWSESVENALKQIESNPDLVNSQDTTNPLVQVLRNVEETLRILADSVLQDQQPIRRRKLEHLIIEHVHQRDVLRDLINKKIASQAKFEWLSQMRFYFDPKCTQLLKQLTIQMANSQFHYGFEYLGVQDKLVQTPLTDRCYLTMTQALEARLGGSPFGPAGTGKTESVKALGHQLGRFVVVFNCDETFDFQAMGRIFVGLCQVGAWGCFDEFNRLEERMLSAVSQQIQTIQEALKEHMQQSKI
jgi:dynein heavy chain 1